jgi:hypothetical protein
MALSDQVIGTNTGVDQQAIKDKIAGLQTQVAGVQQKMTNAKQAGFVPGTPTGNQQIPANVLNAPTQPAQTSSFGVAGSQFDFGNAMQTAIDRLNTINPLTNTRQLLIKHMYDSPLSAEEVAALPQEYQQLINSGDKQELEMGIRLLNDSISGRMGTMDQSVKFLTDLYTKSQEDLEKQKQQEIDNFTKKLDLFGSSILDNYTDEQKRQLETQLGYPEGGLDNLPPTIAELQAGKLSITDRLKLEEQVKAEKAVVSTNLNNYTLADTLLTQGHFPQLTGKMQIGGIPGVSNLLLGGKSRTTQNQLKQLGAILSLSNRQLLKGSGAISDFEAKILDAAASILNVSEKGTTNLTEDELRKALTGIRGVFANAAGMEAPIRAISPTGEVKETTASRAEIEALILEGITVEYIQ